MLQTIPYINRCHHPTLPPLRVRQALSNARQACGLGPTQTQRAKRKRARASPSHLLSPTRWAANPGHFPTDRSHAARLAAGGRHRPLPVN